MQGGDVAAIVALEATSPSAWSLQQIETELQRTSGIALVAVSEKGEILGWCCGFVVAEDGELLKIAVHPARRRKGVAAQLLNDLSRQMVAQGTAQIFLEVRSHNHAALPLYAASGFLETGRRRRYYKDPVDDAVILVRKLVSTAAAKE